VAAMGGAHLGIDPWAVEGNVLCYAEILDFAI
jgi:hypothetical protein